MIEFQQTSYVYLAETPMEANALSDISCVIEEHSLTALAGHTGSGKSTFVQILSGLLTPSAGKALIDGVDLNDNRKDGKKAARAARQKVGMVFQYPEQQLFEETVYADIAFGPIRQGIAGEELEARVREAMALVGLDFATFKDKNPFALSGGEKRRVAIAGVLALKPKYLILDEPMAGLDPGGCEVLRKLIRRLHQQGLTILLVSHQMEDIAALAERVLVLKEGRLHLEGSPAEVFRARDKIREAGLRPPQIQQILDAIAAAGLELPCEALTIAGGVEEVLAHFPQRNGRAQQKKRQAKEDGNGL